MDNDYSKYNQYDSNIVNQPEIEYRTAKYPFTVINQFDSGKKWCSTHCPVCFWNEKYGIWDCLVDKGVPFCRRCGQKLKWDEEG